MNNLEDQIFDIIKRIINDSKIPKNSLLLDEGWIDSLTTIELLTELEQTFSITIDNDELTHDNFNSLTKITSLVSQKCQNK